MQYVKANVRVNELQSQQVQVPPWEFMVLQAIHGEDASMLEVIEVDREPPAADLEYQRLELKYKAGYDDDNKRPWVARVFGEFGEGLDKMQRIIDQASKPIPKGRKTAAA